MMCLDKLKQSIAIVAVIAACALFPALPSVAASAVQVSGAPPSGNRVYVLSGDVYVARGRNPAHRVTDHEMITSDTLIKTGANSAAMLKFEDGQTVSMRAHSQFQVREYYYDAKRIENSKIAFTMLKGGMRFVTGKIGQGNKRAFRLVTPNATINVLGTDFMVAMVGNSIYSQVLKGKVRMTNASGTSVIGAGQSAVAMSAKSDVVLLAASAIPAGTFNELLSVPTLASVIPARPPAPVSVSPIDNSVTPSPAIDSRVYVVSGKVSVAEGKVPARFVPKSAIITSGSLIRTGDNSTALLKFADGQVVTMQPNSTFQVREYRYDARQIENSSIVFSMFQGGMRFITGQIALHRKDAFKLLTPNATIEIRGTDFMVAVMNKATYNQVTVGEILVTNSAGMVDISAGQTAVVATSNSLAALVSGSAIPGGIFSQLPLIPIDPLAIPVSTAGTASVRPPASLAVAPVPKLVPVPTPAVKLAPKPVLSTKPVPAPEPIPAATSDKSSSGIGLSGKVGTLGYGAELNFGSTDSFSARVGINSFNRTYTDTSGTANYEFKMKLQTASALADWYPFKGRFRTSAGVLYNNNKITLSAVPDSAGYSIGGTSYASVNSVKSTISFAKIAPYIGIGWGNPVANDKGWGLISDFGVMFQGKPKNDLVITCTSACPGTLANDAAAENAKLQNDLASFKLWPVISIGVSYQW